MPTVHGQGRCEIGEDCSNGGKTYETGKCSAGDVRIRGTRNSRRGRTEEIDGPSEFADCGRTCWCQIGVVLLLKSV